MNTQEVALISVPHSGTTFTIRLFTDQGYREMGFVDRPEGKTLYHGHVEDGAPVQHIKEMAKRMPVVVPLRHPYRVAESWIRRRKPVPDMVARFRLLMKEIVPLGPYFFPVDSNGKHRALRALSDGLGIPFQTDWALVRSISGTHNLKLEDIEPIEPVRKLVDDMAPLLGRYY